MTPHNLVFKNQPLTKQHLDPAKALQQQHVQREYDTLTHSCCNDPPN
jgi:hypothetical protein